MGDFPKFAHISCLHFMIVRVEIKVEMEFCTYLVMYSKMDNVGRALAYPSLHA